MEVLFEFHVILVQLAIRLRLFCSLLTGRSGAKCVNGRWKLLNEMGNGNGHEIGEIGQTIHRATRAVLRPVAVWMQAV